MLIKAFIFSISLDVELSLREVGTSRHPLTA